MFLYLSILTNIILDMYFTETKCIYVFIDKEIELIHPINKPIVIFEIDQLNVNKSMLKELFYEVVLNKNIFCKGFVILSNQDLFILNYLEELILPSLNGHQFDERKYLILPGNKKSEFSMNPKLNLLNILAVSYDKQQKINYKTNEIKGKEEKEIYNLYTNNFKGNQKHLIDIWISNKGFLFKRNLYPNKFKNLQGMPIRITGFNYLPYVIFGSTNEKSSGIDITLLKLFSKIHNSTLIILQEKEENWHRLYELIRKNHADIALGGFQLSRIYNNLDLTKVYYYTKFKALVPKPKLLKGTLAPFRALCSESWTILTLLYFVFIIISTIIIYTLKSPGHKKSNIVKTWLAIYGMFFSQSPPIPNILIKYKSFFIWIHLTSWMVASVYNSGAASILTVPSYEHAVNTLEELIESDLKLGTFNMEEFSLPLSSSEYERDKKVITHFFEASHQEISNLVQNHGAGIVIEETKYNNYASITIDSKTLEHLQLMDECISSVHLAFICRKQWGLLTSLNNYIMKVVEAGLIYHWEQEAVFLGSSLHYQRSMRLSSLQHHEVTKLKLNHVFGAFLTLSIGLFLAFIVFVLEMEYFNIFKKKLIK